MRVAVVDCGSSKSGDIAAMLRDHGADARLIALDCADAIAHDAVVISGGPRLFTEEPTLVDRFAFVDRLAVPTLGICLGHQAIGMRHGARVFLGAERRCEETICVVQPHQLFDGLGKQPRFVTDHCEGIELPAGWTLLAESPHYAVEAMAHPERALFGVQFHPEVSAKSGRRLLGNFLALARA